MDIEGAYDGVWHEGLIFKMKQLGFNDQLLKWVFDYLRGRTMAVRLGNKVSMEVGLDMGLPQGATLSPMLFNIMLHDVPRAPNGIEVLSYADDITITAWGESIQATKTNLQQYLNDLGTWFNKWRFPLNCTKCAFQIFPKGKLSLELISD